MKRVIEMVPVQARIIDTNLYEAPNGNNHYGNVIDHESNSLMLRDVKLIIAEAFISLEAELRLRKHGKELSEREIMLVEKKTSQMKQEISDFIDSQKQRIIGAPEKMVTLDYNIIDEKVKTYITNLLLEDYIKTRDGKKQVERCEGEEKQ